MKRIKQVFDNRQVAHVWAQQTQETGRSGSMFFEGPVLYSYGKHFPLAVIHTVKSKRIAVLNSTKFSVTTTRHHSEAWSAVNGLMPIFESPDPRDLNCARNYAETQIQFVIDSALKLRKVTSAEEIKTVFHQISVAQTRSNKLRALLGKKAKFISTKTLDQVETHLKARLARHLELNTPEIIAKREAAKLEKERKDLAEGIEKFRRGEHAYGLYNLDHELLRIQGDEVVTSRGARVPLKEARKLYRVMKENPSHLLSVALGQRVGSFTVEAIQPFGADTEIKIGCHKILLSEADQVLGSHLSIVGGVA